MKTIEKRPVLYGSRDPRSRYLDHYGRKNAPVVAKAPGDEEDDDDEELDEEEDDEDFEDDEDDAED